MKYMDTEFLYNKKTLIIKYAEKRIFLLIFWSLFILFCNIVLYIYFFLKIKHLFIKQIELTV